MLEPRRVDNDMTRCAGTATPANCIESRHTVLDSDLHQRLADFSLNLANLAVRRDDGNIRRLLSRVRIKSQQASPFLRGPRVPCP